jgi:hypothetical protein
MMAQFFTTVAALLTQMIHAAGGEDNSAAF